ncbi:MAG: hypothetical protein AB7F41_13240 [Methylocystis sp.]|uniref:hypothetical protein n=1 Tax=Methylocystis sp. TaxID=1911079 RepID=UPI003D0BD8C3
MTHKPIVLALGVAMASATSSAIAADLAEVPPPPPPQEDAYAPDLFAPVGAIVALPGTVATTVVDAFAPPPPPPPPVVASY